MPRKTRNSKTQNRNIRGGDIRTVNDARTRGHNSVICKPTKKDRKQNTVKHIPLTHAEKTRNMKNVKLQENPQKGKKETSYVLPKVQKTRSEKVGTKKKDIRIKNSTDKSVVRHIKKQNKKRR